MIFAVSEQAAALRRRRVLLGLMAVLSAVIGVWAVELVPWWAVAVSGGLVVTFFVVSRISVWRMRRSLDRRYADIRQGCGEDTVFLSRAEATATSDPGDLITDRSTLSRAGDLWDPVPITMPTYVSKPLAPRTVRTIDLSGPPITATASVQPPVTADAPAPVTGPAVTTDEGDDSTGLKQSASA